MNDFVNAKICAGVEQKRETAHEDLRIPLTDISELMREKWAEANDELPEL